MTWSWTEDAATQSNSQPGETPNAGSVAAVPEPRRAAISLVKPADQIVEALIEADERQRNLLTEAQYILWKREVQRYADALEAKDNRDPVVRGLTAELLLPDEEQVYAIDDLLPLGGNALFAGQYKAGKTTFNGQLIKAWADDEPFLGRYGCHRDESRPNVCIFNYEMSEGQTRRWLRKVGVVNTQYVSIVYLRGISYPLGVEAKRKEAARILRDCGAGLWIVDPASRAMAGVGDGNDNRDVNAFTAYLDEIKLEAGVRDLVMNIHMGHASARETDAQRALGAQAWSAWADALWFITRDVKTGARHFSAMGRDVAVDKLLVQYDDEDMSVRLRDFEPDSHAVTEDTVVRIPEAVLAAVGQNPGCSGDRIYREVKGLGVNGRKQDILNTVDDLVRDNKIVRMLAGRGRANSHFLAGTPLPVPPE